MKRASKNVTGFRVIITWDPATPTQKSSSRQGITCELNPMSVCVRSICLLHHVATRRTRVSGHLLLGPLGHPTRYLLMGGFLPLIKCFAEYKKLMGRGPFFGSAGGVTFIAINQRHNPRTKPNWYQYSMKWGYSILVEDFDQLLAVFHRGTNESWGPHFRSNAAF